MELHALPRESVRLALRIPAGDLRRPYQVLSEPEIARVLAGVEEPRDRAMVAVLLGGGLRVSELVALDLRDLIEEGNGELLLHVAHGKADAAGPCRCEVMWASSCGGTLRCPVDGWETMARSSSPAILVRDGGRAGA